MPVSDQFYAGQDDINNVYGSQNITRWSDANNNETEDEKRIDWALEQANIQIDARMTEGSYDSFIPFGKNVDDDVPPMIVLMAATLAGLMLFDTRRIHDAQDPTDQVSQQRKNYDKWIGQIFKGQLKLRDSTGAVMVRDAQNNPFNVNKDTIVTA